jgi:hypothetical protein
MHPLGVEREETPERDGRRAGRARHQALPKTPDPRIDPKSPHSAAARIQERADLPCGGEFAGAAFPC